MTDEFDRLLEGALAARAEGAPACGGVTDVRRRVRRRRQRTSALTVLPVLVGAGAGGAWVRSSEQQSVASNGSDVLSTTTDGVVSTYPTAIGSSGFRCVAATMTAFGQGTWVHFESCEPWVLSDTPASTTPDVEPTTTLWSGPSTASVVFANASTFNGVAMQLMSQHFGAGQPVSSLTKSATSFVMYAGPEDEPLAAAVAAELNLPLEEGIDDRFVSPEDLSSPTVVVVIGDDLGAVLANTVLDEPTTVPAATLDGTPMRCWEPSKVSGGDDAYRYFQTCEATSPPTSVTTDDSVPAVSQPTMGTTTTTLVGNGCQAGRYVILETDTSRQMVADKFDLTVEQMDAANTETPGYNAFYPGLEITIPCPSES